MNAPLSKFLMEFSALPPDVSFELPDAPAFEPIDSEPTIVLTTAAFEKALQEARDAAAFERQADVEARLSARFAEEKDILTREFEEARRSWADQEGVAISASLGTAIAQLESGLSEALANALRPLLTQACRARVLDELGAALEAILSDPAHPPIRIAGPADLLTAFGTEHGSGVSIDYVEADQAELTILTDTTRIETRLAACLGSLALEG